MSIEIQILFYITNLRKFPWLNLSAGMLKFSAWVDMWCDVSFANSSYVATNAKCFITVMRNMLEEKLYTSAKKLNFNFSAICEKSFGKIIFFRKFAISFH